MELANQNNGVLLTKQVTEANLPREGLSRLVKEGLLFQVQRGIYVTEKGFVDDFFLLQSRYPKGIYSHETALYLQGYSDRAPILPTMTFEYGTSTGRMKEEVKPVIVSSDFSLGAIDIMHNGSKLAVYCIERALVDMLKPKYDADFEQFLPALKQYASDSNSDINKLFYYAQHFGVDEEMHKYIGGLL